MPDPLTAAEVAAEGIGICVTLGTKLKRYIESVKNADRSFLVLIETLNRWRNVLLLLDLWKAEIKETDLKDLENYMSADTLRSTFKELQDLADKIGIKFVEATEAHSRTKLLVAGHELTVNIKTVVEMQRKVSMRIKESIDIVKLVDSVTNLRLYRARTSKDIEEAEQRDVQVGFFRPRADSVLGGEGMQPPLVTKPLRVWLGHVATEMTRHSQEYLEDRQTCSEAAFRGHWQEFWRMHQIGIDRWKENWLYSVRMKDRREKFAFWTPLHQAVYHRADLDNLRKMINGGAFRLRRTAWTEYDHKDMTALDLARLFGFHEMYEILAPKVHSFVPGKVLDYLQRWFHHMIIKDLGDWVEDEQMDLPALEVLVELKDESMWFPVKINRESEGAGYLYRLDGRDLLVERCQIRTEQEKTQYRITVRGIHRIEAAILANDPHTVNFPHTDNNPDISKSTDTAKNPDTADNPKPVESHTMMPAT
ncbi:hypothetical protein K461DRAFT_320014 [Myriangium duriaei CBS 260.36]|uniref:Uncharacterized protein n=1 Tax=Myriangium duriaei CBS 260.36 TaxID=1168546 RepID=A0A9P4J469_9PEZI|nr:hypothetical protein K461DRAFT_320014 [Myriangium duriaei CBS 260.36]